MAPRTTTPIEHPIVIVGENLDFDNLFAAVHNLLSLSNNHRQPMMGGTSANFQTLATGHTSRRASMTATASRAPITSSLYERSARCRAVGHCRKRLPSSSRSTRAAPIGTGLYSNPRRIRGQHAHPTDRGLALGQKRRCRPHLYRPRVHPQIRRGLDPLSARSRDHLLNPIADPSDPHVAANRLAIGDSAIANLGIVPSGTAYPMLEALSRDVAIRGDFGLDTNLDGGFP
jgi:hypothetical protein